MRAHGLLLAALLLATMAAASAAAPAAAHRRRPPGIRSNRALLSAHEDWVEQVNNCGRSMSFFCNMSIGVNGHSLLPSLKQLGYVCVALVFFRTVFLLSGGDVFARSHRNFTRRNPSSTWRQRLGLSKLLLPTHTDGLDPAKQEFLEVNRAMLRQAALAGLCSIPIMVLCIIDAKPDADWLSRATIKGLPPKNACLYALPCCTTLFFVLRYFLWGWELKAATRRVEARFPAPAATPPSSPARPALMPTSPECPGLLPASPESPGLVPASPDRSPLRPANRALFSASPPPPKAASSTSTAASSVPDHACQLYDAQCCSIVMVDSGSWWSTLAAPFYWACGTAQEAFEEGNVMMAGIVRIAKQVSPDFNPETDMKQVASTDALVKACARLSSRTTWVEELHQLQAERQGPAEQAALAKRLKKAEKEMREAEAAVQATYLACNTMLARRGAAAVAFKNPTLNAKFQELLKPFRNIVCVTAPIPSDLGHGELQNRWPRAKVTAAMFIVLMPILILCSVPGVLKAFGLWLLARICDMDVPRPKDETLLLYMESDDAAHESADVVLPQSGRGICNSDSVLWAFPRYLLSDGLAMLLFVILVATLFAWAIWKLSQMGRGGLFKGKRRLVYATWMCVFLVFSYFIASVTYGSPLNFLLSMIYLRKEHDVDVMTMAGHATMGAQYYWFDYLCMRMCLAVLKMLLPIVAQSRDYLWLATRLCGLLLGVVVPLCWTPVCLVLCVVLRSTTPLGWCRSPAAAYRMAADVLYRYALRKHGILPHSRGHTEEPVLHQDEYCSDTLFMVYAITLCCCMASPPDVLVGVPCLALYLCVFNYLCQNHYVRCEDDPYAAWLVWTERMDRLVCLLVLATTFTCSWAMQASAVQLWLFALPLVLLAGTTWALRSKGMELEALPASLAVKRYCKALGDRPTAVILAAYESKAQQQAAAVVRKLQRTDLQLRVDGGTLAQFQQALDSPVAAAEPASPPTAAEDVLLAAAAAQAAALEDGLGQVLVGTPASASASSPSYSFAESSWSLGSSSSSSSGGGGGGGGGSSPKQQGEIRPHLPAAAAAATRHAPTPPSLRAQAQAGLFAAAASQPHTARPAQRPTVGRWHPR